MRTRLGLLALAVLVLAAPAFAQTNPTGTISGKVADAQGLPVPGVTVTVESPALQGVRTATTSANGDYIFPFLTPGEYTVTYSLTGFNTIKETRRISPGQTTVVNAAMAVSTLSETIEVTGHVTADFGAGAPVVTSFTNDLVEKLPLNRTLQQTVLLTPGVQGSGPNGNISVNGAMSYDSLYLVNGVVVNENIRGQSLNLFIEDALQETAITTAGVSAEYGRFQGGVVSALTKSGSNEFSGSGRITFDNDKWRALTPYETCEDGHAGCTAGVTPKDPRLDDVVPTYEGTLGGPVMKDKLWFFGAARVRNLSESRVTAVTNIAYPRELKEDRYEGKLTFSPTSKHTFKGAYTKIKSTEDGNSFGAIMDRESLVNRATPQDLLSANYTGIVSSNFFVEAQYSRRRFTFQHSGSQFTDLIKGTLLQDQSRGLNRFNSPTFCGVCEDEKRDNQNIILKASYFLSTSNLGAHNLVGGIDVFDDKRFANNHQSGSDFRVLATSAIIRGTDIFPVFDQNTIIRWTPIFVNTEGNNFRTFSGFVNDAWTLNKNWTFNLGLRFDKNDGKNSAGASVIKDSAISPRVSATFDPKADGKMQFNASYAQYVAAIANGIGDSSSPGGQPATIDFDYLGPAVNTGNPATPLSSADALKTLFDWFNANGGTGRTTRGAPSIPGVNVAITDGLKSPNTRELTLGMMMRLGQKGQVRIDGIHRKFRDFYVTRVDLGTGRVADRNGKPFDLQIVENSNDLERAYKGLNFQLSYRPSDRLGVGGNYTLSELKGNIEGETGGSGPVSTGLLLYPEYFDRAWQFPEGRLLGDVRHKVRLWATWDAPVPKSLGTVTLGALQFFNSGTPFGLALNTNSTVDTRPFITNPGYLTPPASETYFFEPRDKYETKALVRTDLALNWSRGIGVKKVQLFFRGTVDNLFNRDELTNFFDTNCGTGGCINTSYLTNRTTSTIARFNPFTETPAEGTHWRKGPIFGQPVSRYAYQTTRTYRFSLGFRF